MAQLEYVTALTQLEGPLVCAWRGEGWLVPVLVLVSLPCWGTDQLLGLGWDRVLDRRQFAGGVHDQKVLTIAAVPCKGEGTGLD